MPVEWFSLAIFLACYLIFAIKPGWRPWAACIGGALLIATGVQPWKDAIVDKISWNVIGLFVGTLVLAELFMLSRVPALMAEWLVSKTRSPCMAMITLCALAGGISVFVENVAVVLLMAPVAISLSDRLKKNPAPLLIGIALCSNVQGAATMIGDPPSMILAGFMKMGFWDFFIYHGRPGIFFAIQVGMLAVLLALTFFFRKNCGATTFITVEKPRSWVPAIFLLIFVIGLSFSTVVDSDFQWFAGGYSIFLAISALLWHNTKARWTNTATLLKSLDWSTTFFLIGIFVLVGSIESTGWMDRLTEVIVKFTGNSIVTAFVVIVVFSVVISGFVDNVPFLLMMLPVTKHVAEQLHAPVELLLFGLLIGACLGGNLTPIGASANVVTLGILQKHGHPLSFRKFMKISVPITILSVLVSSLFVWWIWHA